MAKKTSSKGSESKTTHKEGGSTKKTATAASKVLRDGRTATEPKSAAGSALSQANSKSKTAGAFYTSPRETNPELIEANRSLDKAARAIRESRDR